MRNPPKDRRLVTNSRRAVRQSQRTDAQLVADQAAHKSEPGAKGPTQSGRKPVSRTSRDGGWEN